MKACLRLLAIAITIFPAFSSSAQQASSSSPKPPVGVPADAKPFGNGWYRVYLEKGSWRRAKEKCATLGGQLAVVHDEDANRFLQQLAGDLMLWLGATDEKVNGAWQWVDGTSMTYKAWGPGQPQGAPKESYLCLLGGKWHDAYDAEPTVVGYICEWHRK